MLFFVLSSTLTAQDTDQKHIASTIEMYILGWRSGDTQILEEAFDIGAGIVLWVDRSKDAEELNSMKLSELAKNVKPHEGYGIGYEILNIDIVDAQLAMAKVKIPLPGKGHYIDYLQLQKINQSWKIVLKSFVYFKKE